MSFMFVHCGNWTFPQIKKKHRFILIWKKKQHEINDAVVDEVNLFTILTV